MSESSADNFAPTVPKRTYSSEEVAHIYELARFWLENGDNTRADLLLRGIVEVSPDFSPGWLGLAYLALQSNQIESGANCAKRAYNADPNSIEAQLFYVSFLIIQGDFGTAGTLLGEVQEKIDGGQTSSQNVIRFYRMQLARYEAR